MALTCTAPRRAQWFALGLCAALVIGCKAASFKTAGSVDGRPSGAASGDGTKGNSGSGDSTEGSPNTANAGGSNANGSSGSGSGSSTDSADNAPAIKANGSTSDITVPPNTPVTITWDAPTATQCVVQPLNATGTKATAQVQATATQTYTLNCQTPGGPTTTTINVVVAPPAAPTTSITANGAPGTQTVKPGDNVTIAWTSSNADSCSLSPAEGKTGSTGTSGTFTKVMPTTPLMYSVTCTGPGGTMTSVVTVNPAGQTSVTAQLKANGTAASIYIPYNTSVELSWTSSGASTCLLAPLNDNHLVGQLTTDKLTATVLYYLTCSGGNQSVISAIAVNVGLMPAPTPDLKINGSDGPLVAAAGAPLDITWTNPNAVTSCSLSPNPGKVGVLADTGEITTNATIEPVTYTLTCKNAGGQGTDSVSVMPAVVPPTAKLTANGQSAGIVTVPSGSMVDLAWTSTGASSCVVTPGHYTGIVGNQSVGPITAVQSYGVLCTGPFGTAAANVVVAPAAPTLTTILTVNGSMTPITVMTGTPLVVAWASSEATKCSVAPFSWSGLAGTRTSPAVTADLTVVLTCVDAGGNQSTAKVPVHVVPDNSNASVTLKANGSTGPLYITQNSPAAQLVWTSVNTVSCAFDDGAVVATYGSSTRSISNDTKYTLTCKTASGGTVTAWIQIYVKASCKRSTKVGINFEDAPIGSRDADFNDFTACTDQGDFSVYGTEVVSERCQTVPFTTSKISNCSHHIRIEIHHPNGTQEKPIEFDDSTAQPTLMLHFQKGSVLEVYVTNLQSCGSKQTTHSMHEPDWAIVKADECRRTGR
ncbi:MAG: hypothetical protein NTZ90_09605 [Proteobacteria bacterium]|nr:hypothetical protein [Pseudomonadota bacterium]